MHRENLVKVLFVDQQINTVKMGGSMHSLDTLLTLLNEFPNIQAHLLTLNSALNATENNRKYRIIEYQTPSPNPLVMHLYLYRILRDISEDYDIIHIYDPTLLIPGGFYKKFSDTKVKIVGNLNSYYFCTNYPLFDGSCHKNCNLKKRIAHSTQKGLDKLLSIPFRLYQQIGFRYINYLDGFTADSEFIKRVYHEFGIKKDIEVIYEIINFELLKKQKNHRYNNFNITFVGRLEKNKGVDILLKAVSELDERDVCIHIVGCGSAEDELKNLADELSLNVVFHGYVKFDRLSEIYSNTDVFVHPARWPEPFGRTIVEAMYYGIPVVIPDVGAPYQYAAKSSIVFKRGSYSDLYRKIKDVYKNKKFRKRLSYLSSKRAVVFQPRNIAKKLIDFYEKILQR